jgi:hypothetical protein
MTRPARKQIEELGRHGSLPFNKSRHPLLVPGTPALPRQSFSASATSSSVTSTPATSVTRSEGFPGTVRVESTTSCPADGTVDEPGASGMHATAVNAKTSPTITRLPG